MRVLYTNLKNPSQTWGGALRDDSKNGCEGDHRKGSQRSAVVSPTPFTLTSHRPLPREGSGDEHVIKTRNVNRRHFAFGADYSSRETPICD